MIPLNSDAKYPESVSDCRLRVRAQSIRLTPTREGQLQVQANQTFSDQLSIGGFQDPLLGFNNLLESKLTGLRGNALHMATVLLERIQLRKR